MKYILLAYTNVTDWQELDAAWKATGEMPAAIAATCEFYEALGKELTESGEFVSAEGLSDPSHSRTVRPHADGAIATDGPFAESKEVLVSFSIVDVASHDRALEIAARVVDAVGDTIEVRPVG